jgi:hypothetical protein
LEAGDTTIGNSIFCNEIINKNWDFDRIYNRKIEMGKHGTRKLGIPKDGIDCKTFARDGNTRETVIAGGNVVDTGRSTEEKTTYINDSHFNKGGSVKIGVGREFTWFTKSNKTKPKGIFGFKIMNHVSMIKLVAKSIFFVSGAREFENGRELLLSIF